MCAEWIPAPLPPLPSPLLQPQFRAFLHLLVELSYSVSQCPLSPSCLPSVQYSSNSRNHVFKIRLGLINTLQVDTVFRIKSRLSQGKEGSPHSPLQLRLSLLIFLLTTLPPTHLLSVSPTGQVCLCLYTCSAFCSEHTVQSLNSHLFSSHLCGPKSNVASIKRTSLLC
jgi:hypothetical protein